MERLEAEPLQCGQQCYQYDCRGDYSLPRSNVHEFLQRLIAEFPAGEERCEFWIEHCEQPGAEHEAGHATNKGVQRALTDRARDQTKKYSSGMKQRLLIARALLHEPKVLFLDEPTRGLDPHIARGLRTFIAGLAQQGVTVFLTTHYIEEADQLCDRVAFIDQGHVVALDTPARLKAEHGENEQTTLEDVFVKLTGHGLSQQWGEN